MLEKRGIQLLASTVDEPAVSVPSSIWADLVWLPVWFRGVLDTAVACRGFPLSLARC